MNILLLSMLMIVAPWAMAQESSTPTPTVHEDAPSASPAEQRIQSLEDRISALEGAPAKTSLSAFNPAMGMALDLTYHHHDGGNNFDLRAAEVNIEAPVDPFLKAWTVITASNDNNKPLDVEEATLETTSLPWNLTLRGGRLFANFGRLPHFHDHELPVTDRPQSIDSFVGGESRADGVEAAYLFPIPVYLNATFGMYDKMGADNTRQDVTGPRTFYEFTYLGRLQTYADITENQNVDFGVSEAWTPKRFVSEAAVPNPVDVRQDTWRTLTGVDLTYRYTPVRGGLYNGVVWGTEVLQNDEQRVDPATFVPVDRVRAYSGYSFIWIKMGLHWRPGVMVDMTEDMDQARKITKTYTAFLTYDMTEFQRLRVCFASATDNVPGSRRNDTIALQWTGVLGHHVHGFRDR